MSQPSDPTVTRLLQRLNAGEEGAAEDLLQLLYQELHRRAARYMRSQPADHTLQPTALVNEAYMRLLGSGQTPWADRNHFLSVAAKAMRSVLVDHARARGRDKRRAPGLQVPLDNLVASHEKRALDLLALDEALRRLAEFDPDMAYAVELRFFGGLTVDEVARILEVPKRTFERNWTATRAWLFAEMK